MPAIRAQTRRHARGQPVWVFDLDDTLHHATPHVFPHINRSMTAYVADSLGIPSEEASALRVRYWHHYGATLLGLMRHHGTDPHHFLRETHRFDDLPSLLVFDRALRAMLRRLPGRKIVFSNAPHAYARDVLAAMGVAQCFDAIYAIEHTRFQPKPRRSGFLRLLRQHRLAPSQCIMVEDSPPNLRTAKQLGMRTVWVSRAIRTPAFVDVRLKSVLDLPRALHKLGRRR